jgi:hypothetical protein
MADADFIIGQGDTGPYLQESLTAPDGTPIPLQSAAVNGMVFRMARRDRSTAALVSTFFAVGDPALGIAQHNWVAPETDNAGWYDYQWEITFVNGQRVTVPEDRYRTLFIRKRIV